MNETSPPDARALLNDATAVLWRGPNSVQFELGSRRLVVDNIESDDLLALLPRRRAPGYDSARSGPDDPAVVSLRAILGAAGFLSTAAAGWESDPVWGTGGSGTRARVPSRLAPDAATLGTGLDAQPGDRLAARGGAVVAVHGTSRLACSVAATLAAAGIGTIQLGDGGDARITDACPGGLLPADEGRRFLLAAAEAVHRAAPEAAAGPTPGERPPDLVVLTEPGPVEPAVRESLHLDGTAHLVASVEATRAVIGPLVEPGSSSCLRCADLHRCERDPAWPVLAVQLAGRPRHRAASDLALCVATAGMAALQALAYLDRQRPTVLNGTLEWDLPDWRLRRRTWPVHQACDCGAAAQTDRARQNGGVIMR